MPTDTVAGIGCLASSRSGVRRVFRIKGRDRRKGLILFVRGIAEAERIAGPLPPRVRRLLGLCWPGALTAVLPLRARLPAGVGKSGRIGLRVPAHPVPLDLVRLAGGPLATTSANLSGGVPVMDSGRAGAVLGARVFPVPGRCGRVPSTVADFSSWPPAVIRRGAFSVARLLRLARKAGLSAGRGEKRPRRDRRNQRK